MAYLHLYPENSKNIDSLVLCVPATNGVNFVGELFSGKFDSDPDSLTAFIKKMVDNEDINTILSIFNKTGTLDAILNDALEPVLRLALLDALKAVVHDIFGTFPSMWSFVYDKDFYSALEYIYGEDYNDPNHDYAAHINRLVTYHEDVMNQSYDLLTAAKEGGMKVNIICKYDQPSVPLSKEGDIMGDGFVKLYDASFGATCGMNKEKLPKDYEQALYPEYDLISPDGCVDASTGLLPLNTWYIKGLTHGGKNDTYYELINTVLYEDLDVFSNAEFPQYLEVPADDDEALVPMTEGEPEKAETSWLYDFLTFLPRLIRMLIDALKGLFNK